MTAFLIMVVIVWAIALGSWVFLSKRVRSSDVGKMKGRILGKEKKKSDEPEKVALFQAEDQVKGKIVRKVLTKYNLTQRIQSFLEQAGVKWDAARFVHGIMAFFIGGYVIFWLFAPAEFRSASLIAAFLAA